jgi:hypothetical protein
MDCYRSPDISRNVVDIRACTRIVRLSMHRDGGTIMSLLAHVIFSVSEGHKIYSWRYQSSLTSSHESSDEGIALEPRGSERAKGRPSRLARRPLLQR